MPNLAAQDRRLQALDPDGMSADEAVSALVALQAHMSRLQSMEVDLLTRAAGATRVVRDVLVEDGSGPGGAVRPSRVVSMVDEVVDEIACALRRPHGTVQSQVNVARLLRGPLARTRALLSCGALTLAHATAIADQAARLAAAPLGHDPDADLVFAAACDRVQDRVLRHAGTETVPQTRVRARRAVVSLDPAGEQARRERARRGCDVTAFGVDDGLAVIEARLPVTDAAWVIATVDARARAAVTDGSTVDDAWLARHGLDADATVGQLRAAAFLDLMRDQGGADGPRLNVEVQVLVDAATVAGLDPDGPSWMCAGPGAPQAGGRDDLIRLLTDPSTAATFRRLVTDPATGALVDRGARAYAASPALSSWIAARDVTCRFPGCTRRAVACDVDHVVDHADGGPTTVANTGALCRRHHNRKTFGGWRIENSQPDGSCIFVSPAGRRYEHAPVELAPEPPLAPDRSPPTSLPPDDDPIPF